MFFHVKKAMLVMDSMRAHITDTVKQAVKGRNSIPAVIPGGTTKYLQPLDISVNRPFKNTIRSEWERWMTSGEKSFTKTGRMRRATYAQVCEWVLSAWGQITTSTITNGFKKAGIVTVENSHRPSSTCQPESSAAIANSVDNAMDTESEGEDGGEGVLMADEHLLQLFHSDTEDEDFEGFTESDIDE